MKFSLLSNDLRTMLLGGGVGLLVLWVYSAYIVGPMVREVGKLGTSVREARTQLAALEQATANETAIRESHRQLDETVVSLRRLLPPEQELPSVIEFLSDLARQTQVKIQSVFPQRPVAEQASAQEKGNTKTPATPVVYKEIPIQIDAQATYHQLGTLLSLVESGERPMDISTLHIAGNPKEPRFHNISMVVLAYFAVTQGATSVK